MALNTKKTLGIAFLWHMHQPYYKDPLKDKYVMPWARLRGTKDYLPMAMLVDKYDSVRATFNLVPSLVEQIIDYAENGASDALGDLAAKDATALSFDDRLDILDKFFRVNFNRVIEPHDRYSELLLKKGIKELSGPAALKKVVAYFTDGDFRDLQVLFSLAWFHSINIDEDPNLRELVNKRKKYSEDDKKYIIRKEKELLGRIIPLYKKMQGEGRIEISTTPYYHPILPLLCDTSIAKISSPKRPLPKKRFSHPEDAEWQISEAIKYCKEIFGRAPRGMWPSEGSVSDEALGIMISKGIDWVATDEEILLKSLSLYDKKYRDRASFDRRIIYRPYKFKKGSKHINMIFRDKNLSDIISFNYNAWDQAEAAWDLMGHFKKIAENLRRCADRGLLTIAMDGENAWEYFEDNGRTFFETLYANMDSIDDVSSNTIGEFLKSDPPRKEISAVFPGSWINHNFNIWIGEEQDNISWGYLDAVRKDLVRFTRQQGPSGPGAENLKKAWRELYIAEGSDWNWWYGGKAHTGGDNPFDPLYRTHLQNIYKLLKKPVPGFLLKPIC